MDPQAELARRMAAAIRATLGEDFADTDPVVRPSNFGDYQSNVALALGRRVGQVPRVLAATLAEAADLTGVARAEVSGPGFINLTLEDAWLADRVAQLGADARQGVVAAETAQTVVVDYSGPNVAKEMHVGHLRGTIIGDALVRVLEFLGHKVVRQNHVGDWGTQFGMLIEYLSKDDLLDPTLLAEDTDGKQAQWENPFLGQLAVGDFNHLYQTARALFDTDPAFAARARERVVALQRRDPRSLEIWRQLVEASETYFSTVYEKLGVLLTPEDIAGESSYNPQLPDVAAELEASGVAQVSQGALCAFPPGFTGRDDGPLPLIVRKGDGGYGYAATDLAAIRHRIKDLGAERLVYVTGAAQALHFAMVFAVARQAGWLTESVQAQHVPVGSVLGPDGKMLRTRSGQSVKLVELIDEAIEQASTVLAERTSLDPDTRSEVASAVGVGAVKYADLSYDRERDYVFDLARMLAFEGNTGPYLQYAHARIRSIFRRANLPVEVPPSVVIALGDPSERALALQLLSFDGVVHELAATLEPHRLTTYLTSLATAFTAFYERCPVLGAEDPSVRQSRLALCALSAQVLRRGLDLLGIHAPERM